MYKLELYRGDAARPLLVTGANEGDVLDCLKGWTGRNDASGLTLEGDCDGWPYKAVLFQFGDEEFIAWDGDERRYPSFSKALSAFADACWYEIKEMS